MAEVATQTDPPAAPAAEPPTAPIPETAVPIAAPAPPAPAAPANAQRWTKIIEELILGRLVLGKHNLSWGVLLVNNLQRFLFPKNAALEWMFRTEGIHRPSSI